MEKTSKIIKPLKFYLVSSMILLKEHPVPSLRLLKEMLNSISHKCYLSTTVGFQENSLHHLLEHSVKAHTKLSITAINHQSPQFHEAVGLLSVNNLPGGENPHW